MNRRQLRRNLRAAVLTGQVGMLAVRGRARTKERPERPGAQC